MSARLSRLAWVASLVLSVACAERGAATPRPSESRPAPSELPDEGDESTTSISSDEAALAEESVPSERPAPPPSTAAIAGARQRCEEVNARFREHGIGAPDLDLEGALSPLRRAADPSGRRLLGGCLYNGGRMSEARLAVEEARRLYDESLAARPNPVVRRRRARLGQREVTSDPSHAQNIAVQLGRVGRCASGCDGVEVVASARSGARQLLRAVLVRVHRDEGYGERSRLYLATAGPSGPYQWGPAVYRPADGMETAMTGARGEIAFLPLRDGEAWDLVVRVHSDWQESCCGGSSAGRDTAVFVCRVSEAAGPAACVYAVEASSCESEANHPGDPDFIPCDAEDTARVQLDSEGMSVSRELLGSRLSETSTPSMTRVIGTRSWAELFPADEREGSAVDPAPAP